MKTITVKYSTPKEIKEALEFIEKNEKKLKKAKELIEGLKENIKKKTPSINGLYQIKVGNVIVGVDIVNEKKIFDQKSFKKEQNDVCESYLIEVPIHTIKLG